MDDRLVKLLIVDDSRAAAAMLSRVLSPFSVVGTAGTGAEALRLCAETRPDVITMDINLPDTDGLTLTRRILGHRRVPIIVVSTVVSPDNQQIVFEALRAGAYDVVAKARFFDGAGAHGEAERLVRLVRSAAFGAAAGRQAAVAAREPVSVAGRRSVVAMGVSTGGPPLLHDVFRALPAAFPAPILVAQHMARGFMEGLAHWLDGQTSLNVRTASHGEVPAAGAVYLPPSGFHLEVAQGGMLLLAAAGAEGHCPSVNRLFESVARVHGPAAICLLLSGMGSDGADGLLAARHAGALTAVQDRDSSIVYGMPGAALRLGAAGDVLPAGGIAGWLLAKTERKNGTG